MSAALLVADSGLLIVLARLDLLDLPARHFESVLVPSTAWEEVRRKPGVDEETRLLSAVDARLIRVFPTRVGMNRPSGWPEHAMLCVATVVSFPYDG